MEGSCELQTGGGEGGSTTGTKETLVMHDAAEVLSAASGQTLVVVAAPEEGAHCLVVEMAADGRGGRATLHG